MNLKEFFEIHPKAALAYSGGTDSTYLMYAAENAGADIKAYFVKSAFQPDRELKDAQKISSELGVKLEIITLDVLGDKDIIENRNNRCYYCKKKIMSAIMKKANEDGYFEIIDGTNSSDNIADRPGTKALEELNIRSPLKECGITKELVRKYSRRANLPTWNKPSASCLAIRIPSGVIITKELLCKTDSAENFLYSIGFRDFRVRLDGDNARIELADGEMMKAVEMKKEITDKLKLYYDKVTLDLEARDE